MFKKIAIFTAGLGFLLAIGIGLVIFNINPLLEKVRPTLTAKISEAVGHPVKLGEMSLSLFPNVAIEVADVGLENAKDSAQASIKNLSLSSGLFTLLKGQVAVDDILLQGVALDVRRTAAGEILIGGASFFSKEDKKEATSPTKSPETISQAQQSEAADSKPALQVNVDSFRIENVNLSFTDETVKPAQRFEISDLNSLLTDIDSAGSANIDLAANVLGAKLSIDGKAGNPLAGLPLDTKLSFMGLNLAKVASIAKAYGTDLGELTLGEQLSLSLNTKGEKGVINLSGDINASSALIKFSDVFHKTSKTSLKVPFEIKTAAAPGSAVNISKLSINLGAFNLNAKAKLPPASQKNGATSFDIDIPSFPLETLSESVVALRSLGLSGKLQAKASGSAPKQKENEKEFNFSKLVLDLALKAPEVLLESSNLSLKSFSLDVDKRNAKQLANINLAIASLVASGVPISNFKLQGQASPKKAIITPSSFVAGGGTVNYSGKIDLIQRRPFSALLNGADIDIGKLVKAAAPEAAVSLSGTISKMRADIKGSLDNLDTSLYGSSDARLINGKIEGINIIASALEKVDGIPGLSGSLTSFVPEKYRFLVTDKDTSYEEFIVSKKVAGQNVTLNILELRHTHYTITGKGTGTTKGDANINAQLKLTGELARDMVLKEAKLELLTNKRGDIVFPIKIKKSAKGVSVFPDTKDLFRRAAKNTAKEAIGRELDKVAPGLGDSLDSLFN